MDPRVIVVINEELTQSFTRFEVETTLKQMAPLKLPNPNGFGACVYQNHRRVIGDEVCQAALSF